MATYYVAEGGTAANKAAATSGTYPGGCMNVTVHNGETFSAGDTIRLSDEGGAFRVGAIATGLGPPSSGSDGSPITYEAKSGDTPIIYGSDLLDSGWTQVTADNYLSLPGENGDYASTPDAAALDITGDIDIRADLAMDDWTPAAQTAIIGKAWLSYILYIETDGKLKFYWYYDGSQRNKTSSAATGFTDGTRHWVRVTMDVDNGSSDADIKFYTSENGTDWSQLGNTQTYGATTAIVANANDVTIGARSSTENLMAGKFYRAQIYDGIGGTLQFDAEFSGEAADTTSFSESSVNAATVTVNQSGDPQAEIVAGVGDNIWYNDSLSTDPHGAWLDDLTYPEAASAAVVDATDRWFWDNGNTRLYVYATEDPATFYSGTGVEAPVRPTTLSVNDKSWLVFDGLTVRYSLNYTVFVEGTSSNNIFQNCTFEFAGLKGSAGGSVGAAFSVVNAAANDNMIDSCTVAGRSAGITCEAIFITGTSGGPDGSIIRNCTIKNGSHTCLKVARTTNSLIEQNYILNEAGFGTCLTLAGAVNETGMVFQHNLIDGNKSSDYGSGNCTLIGDGGKFLYNIFINSTHYPYYMGSWEEEGATAVARNNLIYGNVVYGSTYPGLNLSTSLTAADTGNIFKNNIFFENDTSNQYQIRFAGNQELLDACCEFENNIIFHTGTSNTVYDGGSVRTVSYMESNYSSEWASNVVDNPDLTDPGNDDVTLTIASPAIDTAEDLGAAYDDVLDPSSVWPSAVVLIDQDACGPGWEIGAYARIAAIVAEATSASLADNVTMAFGAGSITIPDSVSASLADNLTMAFSAGEITIPDSVSASTVDNLTMAFIVTAISGITRIAMKMSTVLRR